MKKTKDYNYFEYFSEVATIAVEAAQYLEKTLKDFDYDNFHKNMDEMHEIEHRADSTKHEMIKHLAHEFITPIEREDILALAQELDNVIDCIDDVMICVYEYNIKTLRPEIFEFTALITKCCIALKKVADDFKNFKDAKAIGEAIVEVNTCESDGDKLLSESLRKLYSDDSTDREVMVWDHMYEDLEKCLDAGEDCVDIIESVILNNT